ncbi:UDP-glucose--hexose-1-phosphate uridylyltransferase [Streptococcus gallolyticus]|uniref:UDP-glucose--hexose-1-phosphate uridylyltransferase n=1 Tax=Streptococcus hepaticus TaxID=3349163 RepID=UPI001C9810F0|nr:UDP-glucose--hexose-1-phosphate uridylyltransferase [Streptococcus gallolyticus]MBY5041849.1 UDP-glucose--hexose-1-phosphate uridylyltransferase [Streptococcus gallolyticus]
MTNTLIGKFIDQVIASSSYEKLDRIYLKNRVMALVGEEGVDDETQAENLIDLKDQLVELAVKNGLSGDLLEEQDIVGAQLMDFVTPAPSAVNNQFWATYQENPEQAIADFYALSKRNDYVKIKAIERNIYFPAETEYGQLEITINLSKPEKDPKVIAAAKLAKSSSYPACQLCMENEGYQGRINHPARANHRVIRYQMEGQTWGFQYSPYAYFNEHCIFFYGQHEPMQISPLTFQRLLDIVEQFPGYFAGSNADLPIVGGSILTHEHYQGGRHTFAMEKAELDCQFTFDGFEQVQAGIVKWPMSVLRLISQSKEDLLALSEKILAAWRGYSDPEVCVLAESNGQPHHTITPIARRKGDLFELDLVLRDNQTSEEFPDGIYHPHQDVQHIKKENIGLIEVMGLAILPPRLKNELAVVEDYLLGKVEAVADYHQEWADQLKTAHPDVTAENVTSIVQTAIGQVFSRVLEDAGVYKRTPQGQAAFMRFVESVGLAR